MEKGQKVGHVGNLECCDWWRRVEKGVRKACWASCDHGRCGCTMCQIRSSGSEIQNS